MVDDSDDEGVVGRDDEEEGREDEEEVGEDVVDIEMGEEGDGVEGEEENGDEAEEEWQGTLGNVSETPVSVEDDRVIIVR
ncbi:MAG TPA: hypothetical protein VGH54_14655, partial [Mycobacterium sp.]